MKLKNYHLNKERDISWFGKCFCCHFGEHLGWILFKLPYKIKHHNSIIEGRAQKVIVFLRNFSLLVIEEYQVDPIQQTKETWLRYMETHGQNPPLPSDKVQYEAHLRNIQTYKEVMNFINS